tara:strand:- start:103 stop:768 length:666 start_codon:yes stop_codon:yes gene_type:complete
MKLENYNDKVELIEPWLLKKKGVVEAKLQQFDPNSDDYDEDAHNEAKAEKKLLGGVEMCLAMCDDLDESPEDTKERASFWNTMRISGSKFSDWPIESKNTGSNLTTEQKVVANHQKPLVAGIFKEVLAIEGAEMVLRRIITPSARKGGWFPLGSLEDEMNKLHDKVVKVALTDKLERISLKVEEGVLTYIEMPPLKPKIERKPKKKAEEAPKAPESAEEEE